MAKGIKPPKVLTIKAGDEVMYVMPLGFSPSDDKAQIAKEITDDTVKLGTRKRGRDGKEECCFVHHFMSLKGIPGLGDLQSDFYRKWEGDFIPRLFEGYWDNFQKKRASK